MEDFDPDDGSLDDPPRSWRSVLAAAPVVGAGLVPVGACPVCLAATVGVLSSLGLGFMLETRYLLPIVAGLLGLTLLTLGYRARARRGFGPLIAGIASAAAILADKFFIASGLLLYAGFAGLAGAALWNAWPRRKARRKSCAACDESE